jgi:hypothetical protein
MFASLFTRLLWKDTPFMWNEKYEKSFQELKRRLMSAPVLSLSEEGKPYALYAYAFKVGLGVVLMQDKEVIAYVIQPASARRFNVTIHNKTSLQCLVGQL